MGSLEDIVEEIPYTIPWWNNLIDSFLDWPEKLWRRVNTIVDLFQWQCEGHLLLYVRTALPALGNLVLGLLWFDWDDVARGALRPYGPSGRYSLIAGARKPKWKIEIPELGEEIGKRLPKVSLIKASSFWKGTRALWIVDGLIQRVLYWYLIIDLVSEFLYNWSFGILRAPAECGAAYYARGGKYGEPATPGYHHLVRGGPFSEVVAVPASDEDFYFDGPWIVPRRPIAILGSYRLEPVFPVECKIRWRMGLRREGESFLRDPTPWAYAGPGYCQSMMGVFLPAGPGRWELVAEVDWSSCDSMFEVLEACAIKPITYIRW